MCDVTSGVSEHLDITSPRDVDQRVYYMHRTLIGDAIKKYKAVLFECKNLVKDLAGDSWTLGDLKELSTYNFWTWSKSDVIGYDRGAYLLLDKCADFDKELWFELRTASNSTRTSISFRLDNKDIITNQNKNNTSNTDDILSCVTPRKQKYSVQAASTTTNAIPLNSTLHIASVKLHTTNKLPPTGKK